MVLAAGSMTWYLTRASGAVTLVLLTVSVVLGVLDVQRVSSERWPRFVIDAVHRNVSLLVLVLLALHIVTSVLDGFAPISLLDAVIPLHSTYRPLWLGLGAFAFDLLLAVAITSVVRARLGHRTWRAVHWLAYAAWPVALVHGLGTGTDASTVWMLALSAGCLLAVLTAGAARVLNGWPEPRRVRTGAAAALIAGPVALIAWLPAGPLGSGWARRAGTPASLLGHRTAALAVASTPAPAAAAATSHAPTAGLPTTFTSSAQGTIQQSQDPSGQTTVDLALQLDGGRRLDIRISGDPLPSGGLSMRSSIVELGTSGRPQAYRGAITALTGGHIEALLRNGSSHLHVAADLNIDPAGGSVQGTVRSAPETTS
jgi:methionine sulfoxide reductase heme-binding subunit